MSWSDDGPNEANHVPTVEVQADGKVEQRPAYFECADDMLGLHPRHPGVSMRRLKPQLRAGEQLMETLDGKFIIVKGVLPRAELPGVDEEWDIGNGGW